LAYANLKENFMKNNQFLRSERQVTEIVNFILEQYKNENILDNLEVC